MNSDFLNTYGNIWSLVESIVAVTTFILASFLFLNDPLRRWKFLGFRPTVMIVLFDPKTKKVLLMKSYEWTFNQGSIYTNNITGTIEETLKRELGIDPSLYRIYFVNPLGQVAIKNRQRVKRIALGSISLLPNLIGKGYIGCFLDADFKKLKPKIKLGYGIEKVGIFNLQQIKQRIAETPSLDNPHKTKIHQKVFNQLEDLFTNWPIRRRSL